MRVTAFILARAGSKGLPGKNIKPFMGKPLLAWSIEAGRNCPQIDEIYVSTDGNEIASCAKDHGCEVLMRPDELANDTAMPKDALKYHIAQLDKAGKRPDITVLLQPTSPLREPEDITACLSPILDDGYDSAATFMKAPKSPYFAWVNAPEGPTPFVEDFSPWKRRQDIKPTYCLNGAVYAIKTDVFLSDPTHSFIPGRAKMVIMSDERSVDIDTQLDLDIAETVFKSLKG